MLGGSFGKWLVPRVDGLFATLLLTQLERWAGSGSGGTDVRQRVPSALGPSAPHLADGFAAASGSSSFTGEWCPGKDGTKRTGQLPPWTSLVSPLRRPKSRPRWGRAGSF